MGFDCSMECNLCTLDCTLWVALSSLPLKKVMSETNNRTTLLRARSVIGGIAGLHSCTQYGKVAEYDRAAVVVLL